MRTPHAATQCTHDEALRELGALAAAVAPALVASAFVASLARPPGYWRGPLAALAVARAVPLHPLRETFSGGECRACGLCATHDLEPLDARGVVLPGDLAGALVSLRALAAQGTPPTPTSDDVARFSQLLALAAAQPASVREGKLNEALSKAKLVKGNKYDRRHVIETLGACGVLETPEHPGFTTAWTTFAQRQARPHGNVECDPPIAFWTGAHGVNAANARFWFGALGVTVPATPR